jgi:hypothetical protein
MWSDEVLTLVDLDLTYLLGLLDIFLIGDDFGDLKDNWIMSLRLEPSH